MDATAAARGDGVRGNERALAAVERDVAEIEGELAER